MRSILLIGIAFTVAVTPVLAVDGAFGRSIPGTWILPGAGVVGPDAGFGFTTLPIGFMGSMGGSRLDPVAGVVVSNDQASTSINVLIPGYVYPTNTERVSLSSAVMVPINWWTVSGSQEINGIFQGGASSSNGSVGDVVMIPLTAGIHLTKNNNIAFSTFIWAPTGLWREGNLSNVGMNVWTFMPNFAHTSYLEKPKVEFDNFVGFDIYTRNNTTDYGSGTVFHWDGMVLKYFGDKKVAIGAIGSYLRQLTDDTGPLAELFNGFQARAWAVGPTVLYTARRANPGVTLQLRWLNEFKVTNLLKGNVFMAGVYMSFR